jgi:hypothetical protein
LKIAALLLTVFFPVFASARTRPFLSNQRRCERLLTPVHQLQFSKITFANYPDLTPFRGKADALICARNLPPMKSTDPRFREVERVLDFANAAFYEIRGWTDEEFLEERKEFAHLFSETTDTIRVFDSRPEGNPAARMLGVLAATVAYAGQPGYRGILPMEHSLGWKIDLPFKMELRTYAIPDPNNDVFARVFAALVGVVGDHVNAFPESMKSNCIFTYGDAKGVALYRRMGFELADESKFPPVEHAGYVWRALVITPEKLLKNFARIQSEHVLSDFKNSVHLTEVGGRVLEVSGMHGILFRGERVIGFSLDQPTEISNGLTAATKSRVSLYDDGVIRYVSALDRPFQIGRGAWAAPGSEVAFFSDGTLRYIGKVFRDSEVLPGVHAAKGSRVWSHYDASGNLHIEISLLASPFTDANGVTAAEGATVKLVRKISDDRLRFEYASKLAESHRGRGNRDYAIGSEYTPGARTANQIRDLRQETPVEYPWVEDQ